MNLNGEEREEKKAEEKNKENRKEEQISGTRNDGTGLRSEISSKAAVQFFENSNWLKTNEAAEYLRTGPKQIRKWVYQGKIRAYKLFDKSLRFKRSELDLLMKGVRSWV